MAKPSVLPGAQPYPSIAVQSRHCGQFTRGGGEYDCQEAFGAVKVSGAAQA